MGDSDRAWQEARDAIPRALMEFERCELVGQRLDRAAADARSGRLRAAAAHLEEARRMMVECNVFVRWDTGIWWFAGLIRLIRAMSAEAVVPQEFQRFLGAIPSARLQDDMTRQQLAFWYCESHELFRKAQARHEQRGEMLISLIVVAMIAAVIVYFTYF